MAASAGGTGNLSHSMRNNYDTYGVAQYYSIVSESYRNPHYSGLKKVLDEWMDQYVVQEKPERLNVLDLACGSGEVTEALEDWYQARWPQAPSPTARPPPFASNRIATRPPPATRPPFIPPSVSRPPITPSFTTSRPPFIPPSKKATSATSPSTLPRPPLTITASDPFTSPAYLARTGQTALEFSFEDIASGCLDPVSPSSDKTRPYDIIIVSFALHLITTKSELWALLLALKRLGKYFLVLAPHKKPEIKSNWGWVRWDPSPKWRVAPEGGRSVAGEEGGEGDGYEIVRDRTRLRCWKNEDDVAEDLRENEDET